MSRRRFENIDVPHIRRPHLRGRSIGALAVLGVVVISGLAWLSGATFKGVPVDKIGLHYTGGLFQGQHFKGVISPGTHTKYYGEFDKVYLLPSTQRTYIVSKDPAAGDVRAADFISAPSSDNVPFTFEAAVYFKLNPKPQVLRQFFEQICLHDNCYDLHPGGGWDKMLAQYFRPQIENALRIEIERYDREHLFRDPDTDSVLYGQSAAFVPAVRPAADVVHTICADAEATLRTRPASLLDPST